MKQAQLENDAGQGSEGIIRHVLIHLDEAQVSLDVPSHRVHEGRLAGPRLAMEQVAAMVRNPVLRVEGPGLVLQEPLKVVQQRHFHALPGLSFSRCPPFSPFLRLVKSGRVNFPIRQR